VIALRDFRLLVGAFVLAATVALKGGVLASSNPLELNGGSCLAMAGKGCVALAVDRRFGLEGQLVSTEAKRVLKVWACRDSGVCERERKKSIKVFCWQRSQDIHPSYLRCQTRDCQTRNAAAPQKRPRYSALYLFPVLP